MNTIVNSSESLEQGFERIVAAYRLPALVQAIRDLDSHKAAMDKAYGDPAMREWDTLKYLEGVCARMTSFDVAKRARLLQRRALLTRLCTEEEVEQAIELAKQV